MDDELLKYAIESGMIDLSYLQAKYELDKKEELIKNHPYKIWQGKNGKWCTYLPGETGGRIQRVRNSKKEIVDLVAEYWKEQLENPTIEEVFDEWNDRKTQLGKISNATHDRYDRTFRRFYSEFGKKRMKSVDMMEFEDFLEEQISKHDLTSKAFSNLKTITSGFLRRAKRRKLITWDARNMFLELDTSEKEFSKTIKEDYEEVFDEPETEAMMDYLEGHADLKNLGILLMFITGIRVGELVTLKAADLSENVVKIRRTETRYLGKDGKDVFEVKEFPKTAAGVRDVVVPKEYEWILTELLSLQDKNTVDGYLFISKSGRRMDTSYIRKRQYLICEKLGIYRKSPHKIRKTYGTILLDNNIDKRLIIGQMGHTDIVCTEKHYHRNRRSIDKKSDILSSIPDFMGR